MFKKWFTKKYKVSFHMKSGEVISTTCEGVTINKNGNTLTSYSVEGAPHDFLFYVRLDDISAITLEK